MDDSYRGLERLMIERHAARSLNITPAFRPPTSIPNGGSKMHSIQHEKDTAILFCLCLFNCLSLGSESRRYKDVSAEFGAPWM
ncbi:hypothetical protein, partial [Hafnia alvei]|uniref:hypothetical protein n=1 Tax=Hafnia alvei TaxID=569 RepID=UPI001C103634